MEEGLQLDPLNLPLKLQLDTTTNLILKDLLEGGRMAQQQRTVCCAGLWHVQDPRFLLEGTGPSPSSQLLSRIWITGTATMNALWHNQAGRFSGRSGACHRPKHGAAAAGARKAGSLPHPARLSQQSSLETCRQRQGGSGAPTPPASAAHLSPAILHAPAQAQVGHPAAHPAPHPLPGVGRVLMSDPCKRGLHAILCWGSKGGPNSEPVLECVPGCCLILCSL